MTYPERIDTAAPVIARHDISIDAPLERVWRLHTDVTGWSLWQPDISTSRSDGALTVGSTFHWSTAGLDIASTVYALDVPHRILWGGPAHGITGIHLWTFQPGQHGTVLVRTEESWDGEPVRADPAGIQQALDDSLKHWLGHLKKAAESDQA
ncbi:Shy6-polyketide cyclase [Streptomyces sp. HC44]|uniref:Shy6-polyketide cyclase n=1 Tax=Streptomyces scabichelini TaxID=2711217 RepID=A0A6G4UX02_9ACTN|nr:SRPBCC family protein [Streptomyces scabichelini]NGO06134.1 Shy6-polyketide cyclase [Streptomyces scabichelini]